MSSSSFAKLKQIVVYLYNLKDAEAFTAPVAWREQGLTDYPVIVKRPMDLGTIKVKLENGEYGKTQEVVEDVRLVWTNCKLYNMEGSYFYNIAEKLSKKFEERLSKAAITEDVSFPDISEQSVPNLEEKKELGNSFFKLSSEDLGEAIRMIDKTCPQALDKVSNKDEIEINIDKLSPKMFSNLKDFIKKKYPEEKKGGKKK